MHRYIFFVFLFSISCSDDYSSVKTDADIELPQLVINLNSSIEYVSKEFYTGGYIEIKSNNQSEALPTAPVQLRGRGNTTWSFAKKPYQLKFHEQEQVLSLPPARKWVLLAPYSDKSLLRTEVALSLSRKGQIGWTSASRFVELYINQEYLGVYQLVEKIETTENRVNNGEGFLLEVNGISRLGPDDVYFESNFHLYTVKEPKVTFGDSTYLFIESYIKETENVLFGESFQDPVEGYSKYLNLESFVDWYIVHEITKNNESAWGTSCFLNYVSGEKLKMGPVWDFDLSLGNNYANAGSTEGVSIRGSLWYSRLFQDSIFVNKVKDRYRFYYSHQDEILEEIDANAFRLNDAQERNFTKWPILGVWVWPNAINYPEYSHEVSHLKDWLKNRMDWLNEEIENL